MKYARIRHSIKNENKRKMISNRKVEHRGAAVAESNALYGVPSMYNFTVRNDFFLTSFSMARLIPE